LYEILHTAFPSHPKKHIYLSKLPDDISKLLLSFTESKNKPIISENQI